MEKIKINQTNENAFLIMKKFCEKKLNRTINDFRVTEVYNCILQSEQCQNCSSILDCKQNSKGFSPFILDESTLEIAVQKCQYRKNIDKENSYLENFELLNMPEKLKEASLSNFQIKNSEERKNLLLATNEIIQNYPNVKGLYIYGLLSSGKTYFVAALLNELSKKNIKSILLYYPDLLRLIKDPYNNINNELMNKLINVDVLAIDDLGSENNTFFARDEILSPLLQNRLLSKKLTLIVSNYNRKEILHHLAIDKNGTDNMKAARIAQRIADLTDTFPLSSKYIEEK